MSKSRLNRGRADYGLAFRGQSCKWLGGAAIPSRFIL
jgi:hypothetical protein